VTGDCECGRKPYGFSMETGKLFDQLYNYQLHKKDDVRFVGEKQMDISNLYRMVPNLIAQLCNIMSDKCRC
jgi:hypothetical protein